MKLELKQMMLTGAAHSSWRAKRAALLPSLPSLRSGKYCHYSSFQLEEVEQTAVVEERRVTC